MKQFWLVALPLIVGAFVIWVAWLSSDEPRTRYSFLLAVLGSILLVYESLLLSLCGLGENRGEGFQCGENSYLLPLLGIPVLLAAAWGLSTFRPPWLLGAATLVIVPFLPILLRVI